MFYCDDCADKGMKWPKTPLRLSRGRCEICGQVADCNDTPSRLLPVPERPEGGKA